VYFTPDTTYIREAVSDTLHAMTQGGEPGKEGGNLFGELLHHVYDSHKIDLPFFGEVGLPRFTPLHVGGLTIDLSPTKHVVFLWLAGLLLLIMAITGARKVVKNPIPRGFGNLLEAFVLFVRDEICVPNMGQDGVKYMPYLLTTFFFILIMNLSGLVPYGATATSNISVTGGLAAIAFIMIQTSAIRAQGFGKYLQHLTGGVHWLLWPIMIPIEILGLFTKAFALMIRLFANMIGGHIVIVSLIGLIFIFKSYIIAAGSVLFVLGISMLELFVAFLQAYIFTMLTSLFMGLGMQHAHEAGEEHDH
jgi:F-type H+-transporting ATPase subunit a